MRRSIELLDWRLGRYSWKLFNTTSRAFIKHVFEGGVGDYYHRHSTGWFLELGEKIRDYIVN